MYSLLPGIVAGYFLLIGLLVGIKATQHRARLAFLALCATTVIWQTTWAVLFQVSDPTLAEGFVKFGYLLIIFLPTTLYHFLVEMSQAHQEKKYLYISYSVAALLALTMLSSNLFVTGYYDYYWGYYPKAGAMHPIHVLQTVVVVIRGLYITYQKQKTALNPLKSQLRYCIVSLFIYSLAAIDYLCNYGVEFYPPGIIFITTSLTIIAYALLKKELMAIQVIVTRMGAHTIVAILIILTFIIVNTLSSQTEYLTLTLNIVAALIWGKYGDRLREKLQASSERKWIADWYDPGEVINTITQRLHVALNQQEIIIAVANTLAEVISVKQTHAVIKKSHGGYDCFMNNNSQPHFIPEAHPLLRHMADHPYLVIPFTELPSEIQFHSHADFTPGSIFVSLHSTKKLEGIVVLGDRVSEAHYMPKDRQLFETVARQAEAFFEQAGMTQKMMAETVSAHEKKLVLTRAIAGNIAHELRTPLATISMAAKNLGKYMPALWQGYDLGLKKSAISESQTSLIIPEHRRDALRKTMDDIGRAVHRAQTVITLLLTNVHSNKIDETVFHHYAMRDCVEKALMDYPFQQQEKSKICFNNSHDFIFKGSETLFIYVLYNLIKNALYYIAKAGKGEIQIWMERGSNINTLYFRDTGPGISSATLPQIFDDFFTTKPRDIGNGLGLPFCLRVINSFKGHIECRSHEKEYVEFTIQLPHIND